MASPSFRRYSSVDAGRGLTIGAMIFANNPGDWSHVLGPFSHARWNGCSLIDLGFPTFLFLVGVSLALAGGPRIEAGADLRALQRDWWWRALRLLLLGWALAAVAVWALPPPDLPVPWRPMGILPRIAVCFAVVGWLYLHTGARRRALLYGGLLAAYGLLLWADGDLSPERSLPSRLDAWLLGPLAYRYDPATGLGYDPEGVLSTLGALTNTLLGAQCGDWLRRGQWRRIACAGLVLLVAGYALHRGVMPMNKQLWTPPFALFSGGFSAVALVVVHGLFDVRGWPPVGRRFGVNAITAYTGSILLLCLLDGTPLHRWLYEPLAAALAPYARPAVASHLYALAQVAGWWLVLVWMDKRRIRLTI
ncbi:MAG: heparan-alpha-glucosaminide N-acetyltransferase domain-containing protein [Burkholderiaceae bacterium]